MIEFFRHEAMNQATVISGFCEIIENLLAQPAITVNDQFLPHLKKIIRLVTDFHTVLLEFRDECSLEKGSEDILLQVDPLGDLTPFLSPACAVRFSVLFEIAEALRVTSRLFTAESIGNRKIADRYTFIVESAGNLHELFLHPIAFLQEIIKTNHCRS